MWIVRRNKKTREEMTEKIGFRTRKEKENYKGIDYIMSYFKELNAFLVDIKLIFFFCLLTQSELQKELAPFVQYGRQCQKMDRAYLRGP